MEMNVAFKRSVFIALFVINSSQEEMKYGEFIKVEAYTATSFPFGSIVGLYCVQETDKGIEVFNNDNTAIKIVKNSTLQQEFSNTYQFEVINATTALFKIKNLTTQINGSAFTCQNPKLLIARIVGFNPINDVNPLCSSSYPSRFIFEDSVENDIEMNCTSEEGDPPVTMSTYIRHGDKIKDATNNSARTVSSHPHHSKTLSFTSYFNSSYNNSVFVCNVSQQLPELFQSYQGSCSFGPILFLPLFSVAVTPPRVMSSDVKNTIFRCASNVSEVNLNWTNILIYWKYDFNEGDTYIELVTDTGSDVGSVDIQCLGNYKNKNITSTIQIRAINNPGRVIAVLLVVIFICSFFICVIIIAVRKYHLNVPNCNRNSRSTRNVPAVENSSTNNANDGNISINDDVVSSIVSQTANDNALNVPGTDVPYGDRNITSKMDYNERNDSGRVITVALVITAIIFCLILIIEIVVLYFRLNVSFCNQNPELAEQNSSTNNANVRNTTITDDVVSSMRSHDENSALDVPAMIDNIIYETYTEKNCQNQTLSETERLEKEQQIEMVENEIYESNSFSGYE